MEAGVSEEEGRGRGKRELGIERGREERGRESETREIERGVKRVENGMQISLD